MATTPLDSTIIVPDDLAWHFARRFGLGGDKFLVDEIKKLGPNAWFDQQLNETGIDDSLWKGIEQTQWDYLIGGNKNLYKWYPNGSRVEMAGMSVPNYVIARSVFTKKVLRESMAQFWRDAASVYVSEDKVGAYLVDHENSIHRLALTSTLEVYEAVIYGHAMFRYLDNIVNTKTSPNENLAREILELHTIGGTSLSGAYTEDDVKNFGKLISGFVPTVDANKMGYLKFDPTKHHVGELAFSSGLVLSNSVNTEESVRKEMRIFLERIVKNNYSANYLMTKLALRFVSDTPSAGLIKSLVYIYMRNNTQIKPVLKYLSTHPEFLSSIGKKMKRPDEVIIGTLRAKKPVNLRRPTDWTPEGTRYFFCLPTNALQSCGHRPYDCPIPTGYQDTARAWLGTGTFIARDKYLGRALFCEGDYYDKTSAAAGKQLVTTSHIKMFGFTAETNVYTAINSLWSLLSSIPLPDATSKAIAMYWLNPKTPTTIPASTAKLGIHCTESKCNLILARLALTPEYLVR